MRKHLGGILNKTARPKRESPRGGFYIKIKSLKWLRKSEKY